MLEVEETLGAHNLSPELYKWKQDREVKGCTPVAEPAFQPHLSTPRHLLIPSALWNLDDALSWRPSKHHEMYAQSQLHPLPFACQSESCASWVQNSYALIQKKKMGLYSQLFGE